MSVTAQGKRRHFDEGEDLFNSENVHAEINPNKRYRGHPSPSGRCSTGHFSSFPSYTVGSSTFTAVRALFPRMSDKVIADVLAEYGDNVDAAIKHLNDLQLSIGGADSTDLGAQNGTEQTANPLADGTAAQAGADTEAPTAKTAEQWVDLMVEQMSAASSLENAKSRAAEVLKAFEQAVAQHTTESSASDAARENALLKRAVAIQNARLQELSGKEAEASELKTALEAAKSRCHYLEVQNYSLQLHLKQAADGVNNSLSIAGNKNPDVF